MSGNGKKYNDKKKRSGTAPRLPELTLEEARELQERLEKQIQTLSREKTRTAGAATDRRKSSLLRAMMPRDKGPDPIDELNERLKAVLGFIQQREGEETLLARQRANNQQTRQAIETAMHDIIYGTLITKRDVVGAKKEQIRQCLNLIKGLARDESKTPQGQVSADDMRNMMQNLSEAYDEPIVKMLLDKDFRRDLTEFVERANEFIKKWIAQNAQHEDKGEATMHFARTTGQIEEKWTKLLNDHDMRDDEYEGPVSPTQTLNQARSLMTETTPEGLVIPTFVMEYASLVADCRGSQITREARVERQEMLDDIGQQLKNLAQFEQMINTASQNSDEINANAMQKTFADFQKLEKEVHYTAGPSRKRDSSSGSEHDTTKPSRPRFDS